MPEIMRNLAIAGFLQRLGILIWLGKIRIVFCKGICNNIDIFPISYANNVDQIRLSKEGLFYCYCIFAHKYFLHMSIFYLLVFADKYFTVQIFILLQIIHLRFSKCRQRQAIISHLRKHKEFKLSL